jgi:hypothetical protein
MVARKKTIRKTRKVKEPKWLKALSKKTRTKPYTAKQKARIQHFYFTGTAAKRRSAREAAKPW